MAPLAVTRRTAASGPPDRHPTQTEMRDAANAATRAGLGAGHRRGLVRRRLLRRADPVARLESEPLAGLPLHRAARYAGRRRHRPRTGAARLPRGPGGGELGR